MSDEERPWNEIGYESPDVGGEKPITRAFHPSKLSDFGRRILSLGGSPVVAQAKCQAHRAGCQNTVGVTEDGLAALESWSALLTRRGERPLDLNECFPCDSCRTIRVDAATARAAARREKTSDTIRYCKQASGADLEIAWRHVQGGNRAMHPTTPAAITAAVERLANLSKWLGPGYVNDLLLCLREKRSGDKRGRKEAL